MIIRIALLLLFFAFAVLISADLLLALDMPVLPELITQLGLAVLLTAIALLIITGLLVIIKLIITACFEYFSAGQRLQRHLLFTQSQQDRFRQLFFFRATQINYFNDIKRKQLLTANNRQHIDALSKAINKDLQLIKHQLPKKTYLQLQQENSRYRDQQDIEALLKLQQKIATFI